MQLKKGKNKGFTSTTALALASLTIVTGVTTVAHADTLTQGSDINTTSSVTSASATSQAAASSTVSQALKVTAEEQYQTAKETEQQKLDTLAQSNTAKETQASQAADSTYNQQASQAADKAQSAVASQASALKDHDSQAASQATSTSNAASQASDSYAASQAGVASQASSQATNDTQSYSSQVATDPAKTADQERQNATATKNTADSSADKTLTNAKSDASSVQSQATTDAQNVKQAADAQAAKDEAAAKAKAQAAKENADADALTAKNNADKTASDTKTADISSAQSGKVSSSVINAVTDATNQLDADLDAVDEANANTSTTYVAIPADNNTDAQFGSSHIIESSKNLPTSIIDPKLSNSVTNDPNAEPIGYYGEDLKNDDSEVVTGDLTTSQQKELADYAVTLINSWRKAQGISPIIWTQQSQDATVAVAQMRKKNGLGAIHTAYDTNSYKEFTEISNSYGLTYSQENMGFLDSLHDKVTMTLFKAQILNVITQMIYQDASSNWGHKSNFINMTNIGFAVQKNADPATSEIFPYILVFDGYTEATSTAGTVLTPTSAQTIEASRTSGGATQAQLDKVASDKVTLANAKTALTTATDVLTQSIATQVANINTAYTKKLQASTDAYQAKLTQNATTYKAAIASAEQVYANALTANTANETAKLAQAKTTYDAAIAKATNVHAVAIKQALTMFDTAYANAHDETPAELTARHEAMLDAFKASEATKLANLKTQQATDLKNFKAKQDKIVSDFLAKQATDRAKFVAGQETERAAFDKKSATELANLQAQLTSDYNKMVKADTVTYNQAKAASDKYLDSINPDKVDETTDTTGATSTTDSSNSTGTTGTTTSHATNTVNTASNASAKTGYVYDLTAHKMVQVHYDAEGNALDANGKVVVSANHDGTTDVAQVRENSATNVSLTAVDEANDASKVTAKRTNKALAKLPQTDESGTTKAAGFGATMMAVLMGIMGAAFTTRRRHG